MSRFFLLLLSPLLLTGCMMNAVRSTALGSSVSDDRGVAVFGIDVQDNANYQFPDFGVTLDKYDLQTQAAGNCFRYDRMKASMAAKPGMVKYFSYEVPAGAYVYSAFNGSPLQGSASVKNDDESPAFIVPKGGIVYIGDFVLQGNVVTLRHDGNALKKASIPGMHEQLALADIEPVKSPKIFICTP